MTDVSPSTLRREWTIGLDPWIVQDGNYGEFSLNEMTCASSPWSSTWTA